MDQENTTQGDDMEEECIFKVLDDADRDNLPRGMVQEVDSCSEHSSDFGNDKEGNSGDDEEIRDEESIVDEDLYGY